MPAERCLWSVEDDKECGSWYVAGYVQVKGRVTNGKIPVCARHKAEHDRAYAKLRTKKK